MTAKLQPPVAAPAIKVTVIAKPADPARRKRIVRLLAMLLDKPDAPEEGRRP